MLLSFKPHNQTTSRFHAGIDNVREDLVRELVENPRLFD